MVISKDQQIRLTEILFTIYIVVLVWIILFKMSFSIHDLPAIRNVNFIPFAESTIVNGQVAYSEIVANALIFIPFGMYLSQLKPSWTFNEKVIVMAGTSFLLELSQYVLAIEGTDITDLIMNTVGGIIGVGVFLIFSKLFKERTHRMLNIISGVGTISIVGLLISLVVTNL